MLKNIANQTCFRNVRGMRQMINMLKYEYIKNWNC